MSRVRVVELQTYADPTNRTFARFILKSDGEVELVGLTPEGFIQACLLVQHGLPGSSGPVYPSAGEEYLELLPECFRGTYMWATPIKEMEEADAYKGVVKMSKVWSLQLLIEKGISTKEEFFDMLIRVQMEYKNKNKDKP